jgi:hypothetical protein
MKLVFKVCLCRLAESDCALRVTYAHSCSADSALAKGEARCLAGPAAVEHLHRERFIDVDVTTSYTYYYYYTMLNTGIELSSHSLSRCC